MCGPLRCGAPPFARYSAFGFRISPPFAAPAGTARRPPGTPSRSAVIPFTCRWSTFTGFARHFQAAGVAGCGPGVWRAAKPAGLLIAKQAFNTARALGLRSGHFAGSGVCDLPLLASRLFVPFTRIQAPFVIAHTLRPAVGANGSLPPAAARQLSPGTDRLRPFHPARRSPHPFVAPGRDPGLLPAFRRAISSPFSASLQFRFHRFRALSRFHFHWGFGPVSVSPLFPDPLPDPSILWGLPRTGIFPIIGRFRAFPAAPIDPPLPIQAHFRHILTSYRVSGLLSGVSGLGLIAQLLFWGRCARALRAAPPHTRAGMVCLFRHHYNICSRLIRGFPSSIFLALFSPGVRVIGRARAHRAWGHGGIRASLAIFGPGF